MYEVEEEETELDMKNNGSVITHLLSQVIFLIREDFTKKSTKKSGDSPNGGSRGRFGKSPDFFVDFFCETFPNSDSRIYEP